MRKVLEEGAPPESEMVPFAAMIPAVDLPPWYRFEEIESIIQESAVEAVNKLWYECQISPGRILGRKNVPPELRSQAARSMLAKRGGKATAAKMKVLGYPNLIKAREALRRKAAETESSKDQA